MAASTSIRTSSNFTPGTSGSQDELARIANQVERGKPTARPGEPMINAHPRGERAAQQYPEIQRLSVVASASSSPSAKTRSRVLSAGEASSRNSCDSRQAKESCDVRSCSPGIRGPRSARVDAGFVGLSASETRTRSIRAHAHGRPLPSGCARRAWNRCVACGCGPCWERPPARPRSPVLGRSTDDAKLGLAELLPQRSDSPRGVQEPESRSVISESSVEVGGDGARAGSPPVRAQTAG